MSLFEDIMNNLEDYPELGELIPDAEDDVVSAHPVLDWLHGKRKRPDISDFDKYFSPKIKGEGR